MYKGGMVRGADQCYAGASDSAIVTHTRVASDVLYIYVYCL